MKKLLSLTFLIAGSIFGQTTVVQRPDCLLPLGALTTAPTNVPATLGFDNRTAGCTFWVLVYNSRGFSALSLLVQTAPNATGEIPGAWSTFTAASGANPNTTTTENTSTFGGSTSYFPWVRVQLTSKTGTGSLTGALYGWKTPAAGSGGGGGGSGCVGTSGTPCVVDGPTPAGSAPTFPPVMISGQTGNQAAPGTVQTLHVDANGNTIVVGTAADGAAASGFPVRIGGKDGSGNTQDVITDTRGDLLIVVDGNPTPLSGQQSVTTSAVALATNTVRGVCVKAFKGNSINVYLGPSGVTTSSGMELAPGDAQCIPITNTNLLFVIAASGGNSVSWMATAP